MRDNFLRCLFIFFLTIFVASCHYIVVDNSDLSASNPTQKEETAKHEKEPEAEDDKSSEQQQESKPSESQTPSSEGESSNPTEKTPTDDKNPTEEEQPQSPSGEDNSENEKEPTSEEIEQNPTEPGKEEKDDGDREEETSEPGTKEEDADQNEEFLPQFYKVDTNYKNPLQWYLPAMQMSEVWQLLNDYKRTKIQVAVIDVDIRLGHQEFEGIINKKLSYDVEKNSTIASAGRIGVNTGHGTGVISVLAANGKNMQGVAQGAIEIIPVAIDNSIESGVYEKLKSCIKAFKYIESIVANKKAKNLKVINLSSSYIENDIKESAGSEDYSAAIAELESIISRLKNDYGVLTVAAGGNIVYGKTSPSDFVVPSDFDCSFGVTATTKEGTHQQGFCYNLHKDLSAPGVDIFVATNNSNTSYFQKLTSEYPTGTSYSAPIVSAVAAMIFSLNPNLTPAEVESILKGSATPLPKEFLNTSNSVEMLVQNGSSGLVNPLNAIRIVAQSLSEQ